MNQDPYTPPGSVVADSTGQPLGFVPDVLAIIAGLVIVQSLVILVAPVLDLKIFALLGLTSSEDVISVFLVIDLVVSGLMELLVFWSAGRVSRSGKPRIVATLAVLSLLFTVAFRALIGQYSGGSFPLWYEVALVAGIAVSGAIATTLIASRYRREQLIG